MTWVVVVAIAGWAFAAVLYRKLLNSDSALRLERQHSAQLETAYVAARLQLQELATKRSPLITPARKR